MRSPRRAVSAFRVFSLFGIAITVLGFVSATSRCSIAVPDDHGAPGTEMTPRG